MSEVRDAMYDSLRHRVRNAVKRHDEARLAELVITSTIAGTFNVWRLVDEQALLTEDTATWWARARPRVHGDVDAVLGSD